MPVMESPPGPYTVIDGRRYLYFVGTGYLGLQGHPELIRAACEATQQYGIGSATSRTGFGSTPPVLDVECRAADFFAADDAFYFASGYSGVSILTQACRAAFDVVFVDALSHYSVIEGARLANNPLVYFRHRDPDDLAASLKANLLARQRPLVLTDGVFAARGTIAPVDAYQSVLRDYPGAILCIDDAHGLAVLGPHGRGTYEFFHISTDHVNALALIDDVAPDSPVPSPTSMSAKTLTSQDTLAAEAPARDPPGRANTPHRSQTAPPPLPCPALLHCSTLSKAMGGFGGIIAGSQIFIHQLKARSQYYRGASAPPAPAAAATAKALQLVIAEPDMRVRLSQNVAHLKAGLRSLGLPVDDTPSPIICLALGDGTNMRRIQQQLMERGIAIAYMGAYAGLDTQGALRLALFATHTPPMIEQLLEELRRVV